jgi:hypothetical protein
MASETELDHKGNRRALSNKMNRKLHVSGLPRGAESADLQHYFASHYGPVVAAEIHQSYGFVVSPVSHSFADAT